MKFYEITKGQLITIWIFGLIVTFIALDEYDNYLSALMPGFLVFYTIGWKNWKQKTNN